MLPPLSSFICSCSTFLSWDLYSRRSSVALFLRGLAVLVCCSCSTFLSWDLYSGRSSVALFLRGLAVLHFFLEISIPGVLRSRSSSVALQCSSGCAVIISVPVLHFFLEITISGRSSVALHSKGNLIYYTAPFIKHKWMQRERQSSRLANMQHKPTSDLSWFCRSAIWCCFSLSSLASASFLTPASEPEWNRYVNSLPSLLTPASEPEWNRYVNSLPSLLDKTGRGIIHYFINFVQYKIAKVTRKSWFIDGLKITE